MGRDPEIDATLNWMLTVDNRRMRKAGMKLAEAALRVIREYDGTHRLAIAVAEWSQAIADEGGRIEGSVSSDVTEEEVEAAAKAMWENQIWFGVGRPRLILWESEVEEARVEYRRLARAALHAVALAAGHAPPPGSSGEGV